METDPGSVETDVTVIVADREFVLVQAEHSRGLSFPFLATVATCALFALYP
jgi:hypothetical protein